MNKEKKQFDLDGFFESNDFAENGVEYIHVEHCKYEQGKVIAGIIESLESSPWLYLVLRKGSGETEKRIGAAVNFELKKFLAENKIVFGLTAIRIDPKEKVSIKNRSMWIFRIIAANIDGSPISKRTPAERAEMEKILFGDDEIDETSF